MCSPNQDMKNDASNPHLPFVGLPLVAMLEMVTKWGVDIPRRMGMREDTHRDVAAAVLRGLLGGLCKSLQGIELTIELVREWQSPWPRPPAQWNAVVQSVREDGLCDLEDWVDRVAQDHPAPGRQWWSEASLLRLIASLKSGSLWDLIAGTAMTKGFEALHLQLIWDLGMRLQGLLLESVLKKVTLRGIGLRREAFSDIEGQAHTMDRKLAEYVASARAFAASLQVRCISLCTDKASVCGLGAGLQNTVFTVGDSGVAIFGVPQVDF